MTLSAHAAFRRYMLALLFDIQQLQQLGRLARVEVTKQVSAKSVIMLFGRQTAAMQPAPFTK